MPYAFDLCRLSSVTPSALYLIASTTSHSVRRDESTRSTPSTSQKGSTYTHTTCCAPWQCGPAPLTLAVWPSFPSQSARTTRRHTASTSAADTKIIHLPQPYLCCLSVEVSVSSVFDSELSHAAEIASICSRPCAPPSPTADV